MATAGVPVKVMVWLSFPPDVTVREAEPVIPLMVALMAAEPAATPVACPLVGFVLLTVATDVLVELQDADAVMSFWEPSLYEPVAANCRVPPTPIVAVAGETTIDVKTATPVPVSAAVCGLPTALSLISNWPVRVPAAKGEKLTATLQDPPAASVAGEMGQLLVSEKFPVVWIELIERATGWMFVTWIVLFVLVVPMFWAPKVSELGDSATGLIPVPLRLAVVGDP